MSNNKIGIEVEVKFPSVKELQTQLAHKWKGVKNSFEGKINVSVDGNSLKKLKKQIQGTLNEKLFDIKIDSKSAIKGIQKIKNELKTLDSQIDKRREVKIRYNLSDMDRTFKELLNNNNKVDKAVQEQSKHQKDINRQLDSQIDKASKFQRIQKQLKDGSVNTTLKWTENAPMGSSKVTTRNSDGTSSISETENRERALKEIEAVLKRIHRIELDQVNAEGQSFKMLERERKLQQEQLSLLENQYREKHKISSLDDNSIKELKRQQEFNVELKTTNALKNAQQNEDKEISKIISRVIQLEKEKQNLVKKSHSAKEGELKSLKDEYNHHDNIQRKLQSQYNLQDRMTSEQKESLEMVKKIGHIESQRAREKAEQQRADDRANKALKEQRETTKSLQQDMKAVHKLKLDILKIEEKMRNGNVSNAERQRLDILKNELKYANDRRDTNRRLLESEGKITNEVKKTLDAQRDVYKKERDRVREASQIEQKHADINRKLSEYESISKTINQLQRDLIFAGMREKTVIERQTSALRDKQSRLHKELTDVNAISDARQKEIDKLKRIQREQANLNRMRQDAREKDRSFDDTGGLIDPYSYFMNVERGAMAIFEPVARLDEALVSITKVADATDAQFREFAESSYDVGSSLGVTADEYMKAVEKWVTAGKTFTESQELAEISMTGAFVGNIAPDDMVKYMSVPFQAFKEEGLDANDIINVMNETANNHAIEMDDLGKAYVRSATTAKNVGVSFEELTALITGAQEATRKGGERIGTSLKTVGINLTNMNAQLTPAEERKFNFFDDMDVDFRDANDEMLSMTEILDNLAGKWDDMTQDEKGTATFYMAGKEHAETLMAIMDEWDDSIASTLNDATGEMGRGEFGSAYIEHEKQADSVKFKLAELKNAWDELMLTLGGGQDGVVKVMDALIEGLEMANKLAQNEKLMEMLKMILLGTGMHATANLVKRIFDTMITGASGYFNTIKNAGAFVAGKNSKNKMKNQQGNNQGVNGGVNGYYGGMNGYYGGNNGNNGQNGHPNNPNNGGTNKGSNVVAMPSLGGAGGKGKDGAKDTTKDLKKVEDSSEKASQSVGRLAGGLSKALGFIPLIGDALLILEITGVPVFEKIGEWISNIGKSSEDVIKTYEEGIEKFKLTNGIANGEMDKTIEKTSELEEAFGEALSGDNEGEKLWNFEGYLSEEDYVALRDQFNSLADELGLDIEITMNDTEHIKEKIRELKSELSKLDAESTKELGDKLISDLQTRSDEEKKYNENLERRAELEEKIAGLEEKREEYKKTGKLSSPMAQKDLDKLNQYRRELEGINDEMEGHEERMSAYDAGIQELTDALLEQGGTLNTLKFDYGETKQLIEPMKDGFLDLRDALNESSEAQEELADSAELTDEQWRNLQQTFPELAENYSTKTAQMINDNQDLRDEIDEVVQAQVDADEQALISASEALIVMARRAGMEQEVQEEIKNTGSINEETMDKILQKLGELPDRKTTVVEMDGQDNGFNPLYERFKWLKDTPNQTKTVTFQTRLEDSRNLLTSGAGGLRMRQALGNRSISTAGDVEADTGVSTGVGAGDGSVSNASTSSAGDLIRTPTQVASIDRATSSKKGKKKNDAKKERVSSDIWRYWKTEMRIDDIGKSVEDLTRAIQNSSENEKKMIKLYQEQNKELKKQRSRYGTLNRQKQSEMNSVLKDLRKYGFKTKGNDVTNLGRSKRFYGDKASRVEELLNDWKRISSDMAGISKNMVDLNQSIKDNNKAIKEARIQQESKGFNKQSKRIDSLLQTVTNNDSMHSQKLNFTSDLDKELGLRETEKAMNTSVKNMKLLMSEFNKLSTARIKYKETGEALQPQLESMASAILAQADAMVAYQQSINDLEINRVTDDMNRFNEAVDSNTSKISNNVANLREGLLSGTKIKDLQSSISSSLDLNRDNKFEKIARQRIALEQQVQQALEKFAKKNIDRSKNVANTTLKINQNMYKQLLDMENAYTNGKAQSFKKINATLNNVKTVAKDKDYKLVKELDKHFNAVQKKQDELTKKYNKAMSKSLSMDKEEALTNQYIIDNLKVQERYFKALINANKDAVSQLKKQLKDSTLTDEQVDQIKQQIKSYEQSIIDAQNNIKSSVRERLEFELELMSDVFNKYDEYAGKLEYTMSVLDAIGGENNHARGVIYREMLSAEKSRNNELDKTIDSIKSQLALYKEGSFEWNILNEQLKEYRELLKSSNLELLEMNKNIMSNSFDSTISKIEKSLFNGDTLDKLKRHQELWMEGLEREIALEDAYDKIAELGTKVHDEKMAQLAKQEKLSRFEMDYLNKQLDILELQQKLDNLNQERTVQILKQQEDGTWDWSYEADASELSKTEEELRNAQLELEKQRQEAQEDYLSKLQSILDDAQEGNFDSVGEFQDAIRQLGDAFGTILEDFPQIQDGYLDELVEAYGKYLSESKDIVDDARSPIVDNTEFKEFSNDIVKVFDEISKNIGDSIANVLINKIPNFGGVKSVPQSTDKSISINLDKVEFPNATNGEEVQKAILSLPQIALQKSKEKL